MPTFPLRTLLRRNLPQPGLIDFLGLFRGSKLFESDDVDREALAAAGRLAELASELTASGGGGDAGEDSKPPLLSQDELRELNRILLRKTWERRDDLQLVSRRFAATLLDQTASRVLERKS